MKRLHYGLLAGLSVTVLLGCTAYQQMRDYRDFEALCEREAGLHIYKTVQADEIFYETENCGTLCAITLIDSQSLQRLGFCNEKHFGYFPDRKAPGCYVYEKGLKGDPACFNELEGQILLRKNKNFFETQCVKLLPMDEKFRYRLRADFKVDFIDEKIRSAILKSKVEIFDSVKNELILKKNSFTFVPRNYGPMRDYGSRTCKNTYIEKGGAKESTVIDMIFR